MSFVCPDCEGDHYPSCGEKVEPAFFGWLEVQGDDARRVTRQQMNHGDWSAYYRWLKGDCSPIERPAQCLSRKPGFFRRLMLLANGK